MPHPLDIHFITHQYGSNNCWSLCEGWLNTGALGRDLNLHVATKVTYIDPDPKFWDTLPYSDGIVLTAQNGPNLSNMHQAHQWLDRHKLWDKTVFLDDHDAGINWPNEGLVPKCRKSFIARRFLFERLAEKYPDKEIIWWPYLGIEDRVTRYQGAMPWQLWKVWPDVKPAS